MPWLVGTALIHSLAVTEKRGAFKSWTVLLAIVAFSLSLLGTFLVRSGVLTSVHAFATDPAARHLHPRLPRGGDRRLARAVRLARAEGRAGRRVRRWCRASRCCSRTTCCSRWPRGRCCSARSTRCSSTRSASARSRSARRTSTRCSCRSWRRLVFLMGVGPIARWKKAQLPELAVRLRWALGVSAGGGAGCCRLAGNWTPLIALGLLLAFWLIAADRSPASCERVRCINGRAVAARSRRRAAQLLGHAARAPRRRGVHHRRDAGEGLRDRERRAHERRRHGRRSAATCSASRALARCAGPNYERRARHDRRHAKSGAVCTSCIPRSASTTCSRCR